MEGHLLLYTDSVQAQFHLFHFQKCNFRWLLWCGNITIPENASFLQNTSCMFITCWCILWHLPLPEDSRAVTSFTGLTYELMSLSLTLMPGTLSHHLHHACGRAHGQLWGTYTCSVSQRNLLWMEPSAGTGHWWNLGSAHPCELMKPRTQKSSYLKSVQLTGRFVLEIKKRANIFRDGFCALLS